MSVLEELYYGNIHPVEKSMKSDEEYTKLTERITRRIDKLLPMLSDDAIPLWDEICEMGAEHEGMWIKSSFIEGFCLGAQIMKEIMDKQYDERNIL